MAAVFFAGALGTLFYNRIIAIIGQKVLKEIRDDLFVKMQTFPIRFFDTHTHGDIMSVYTNDTDTLRQFIAQSLPMMISSLVTIVFAFCFMLRFHMVLTGIVAVLSAGMVTAARAMIRRSGTYFARQQDSTGAGKTTITNLINRFYDLADGKIRYDGINITKIRKTDLRRSMGMILQDVNLFTGTVMDNIRYGRLDATDEECIRAAKLSGADSFITRLPEGYQTVISGDNNNLSQGQCQLISIARAAVADPPVMIMDEATSSIDTRTEAIVQDGMDALMDGRTVFVIAHRLSTVRNSKAIMVLEQGRIIERGSHEQLIAEKGPYYQLYTGAFELE